VSVAYRIAQVAGEKRDVSAKITVALQQFLKRCVFFATFATLSAMSTGSFFQSERHRPCVGYYFSMKTAAFVHRRYMSLIVMLMP
jgi:hypothetical protein